MAWAQGASTPPVSDELLRTPPQVSIVISEHKTGSDMISVTMLDPKYPEDLLRSQILALGQYAKADIQGLYVQTRDLGDSAKLRFVKASFATANLLEPGLGIVRLRPILQAFAGGPAGFEIRSLSITLPDFRPRANTIARFGSKSALVVGIPQQSGPGVEYRVILLTQDPREIDVPDEVQKKLLSSQPKPDSTPSNPLMWVLVGVGALSAGVLVYSLALRLGSK
ncbi:MAG TPA: hypothetical protein PKY51_06455 [Fimbriimonadaceae bacterium]|nr:hypothetical protein [Fimbriimonadaceae bacterium]